MKENRIYLIILIMFFTFNSILPSSVSAVIPSEDNLDEEDVVLLSEEADEDIKLFESVDTIEQNQEVEFISDNTPAIVLHHVSTEEVNDVEYVFIRYEKEIDSNKKEQYNIEGYVERDTVIPLDLVDEFKADRLIDEDKQNDVTSPESENDSTAMTEEQDDSELEDSNEKLDEEPSENKEISEENISEKESSSDEEKVLNLSRSLNQTIYYGIAIKDKIHVYEKQSTSSSVLKSYSEGSILKYSSSSQNWYEAKVKVNGVYTIGYIHKSHVENRIDQPETFRGISIKSPTHVYANASTSSKALKSYSAGRILKYQSFSENWYEAKVKVNGVYTTGYIHKSHVENRIDQPETFRGIGIKSPTHVYANAYTSSKALKSYSAGKILKYQSFSKNWYQAKVKVNGAYTSGYIHKSHIENKNNNQEDGFGVGLKNNTQIYSNASTSSKALKSYKKGSILKYKTFSKNWHEVKVKVSGVYKTGYIHKSHVGTPANQETLQGIVSNKVTKIHEHPMSSSKVLKEYSEGRILKYKTYANDWYEAKVKVNGSYKVGYISKKQVEDIAQKQETIKGKAKNSITNIYNKTSKNSKVLKSYKAGSALKFKTYTDNWYEAKVKVKGSYETGYIHVSDISSVNGKLVYLDPGHGGNDSGAQANGLQEKNLTLEIAKYVQNLLESKGFIVKMARTTDKYLSLSERTNDANKVNADIFVSIHINSGGGTGIETFKMDGGPEPQKSSILAQELQKELIKQTKVRDRGVKDENFHVNRESKMPSSLVELGFIDTKADADKLKTTSFKKKAAQGIVNGIKSYFNLIH